MPVLYHLYNRFPQGLKASVRVSVAVTAIAMFALVTYPIDSSDIAFSNQALKGGEWAAVTAVLIPYTTIGEAGPISMAQILATAAGGYLAFAFVVVLKEPWALALLVVCVCIALYVQAFPMFPTPHSPHISFTPCTLIHPMHSPYR